MVTTTQTVQTANDPFDSADKAQPLSRHYFGSLLVDAYYAVLEKGVGKALFDPQKHSADRRVTALTIILTPTIRPGGQEYKIERQLIAESADWTKIVKPSLDKLGVSLKSLNYKWAEAELVETGTYVNKANETKTRTMFRFLAIFSTEAECQQAAGKFYATRNTEEPQAAQVQAAPPPPTTSAPTAERATATKFLTALWSGAAKGDPATIVDRFLATIAASPLTAKYFDAASPEVGAIILANTK